MSPGATLLHTRVAEIYRCLDEGLPLPPGVEALQGGITNRNYRLEVDAEAYVLRLGGKDTHLLGVDRSRERAAASIAGTLGVGAEVVWTDPSRDAMVTRFIPGPILTAETASEPATLRRIVEAVREVHTGPAFPGRFSAFDAASELHQLALQKGVVPPPDLADAFVHLARIEAALPPYGQEVPCHDDLLPGNFIDDGRRIRIIDWEYAAMGDPFFDLGNLAVNLALPDPACRNLLEYYFGEAREPDLARLYLMRMASDMRECCWGFLSHGISSLEFDYYAYGTRHLNRFLHAAREEPFMGRLREGRRSRPHPTLP